MDIRDIKETVHYPENRGLEQIFELQKGLIDHYVGIEGLPEYPVNVNTKKAQILIKDFVGRVLEELGEGFESYLTNLEMFHQGFPEEDMIPNLQNFNEEIADALHFFIELLIYAGITTENLHQFMGEFYGSKKDSNDILKNYIQLGHLLYTSDKGNLRLPCRYIIKDEDLEDEFLRGGRKLSTKISNHSKEFLWDIVYYLELARNTLKNKPWKQTEMLTDEERFKENILIAWVYLFKYLAFAGFTAESVYTIYYKKNRVNHFRIKSKY